MIEPDPQLEAIPMNETIAIPWSELVAGAWAPGFVERPCESGVLAVGRRWPGWRTGAPPTWAAFVADREIDGADRRWLVARVLVRDRRRLVAWAVDCAETVVHLAPDQEASIRRDVLAPLRCWIGGAAVDLAGVRERAWDAAAARGARVDAGYAVRAVRNAASAAGFASDSAASAAAADAACDMAASTASYAARAAAARTASSVTASFAAYPAYADRMLALALPHLEAVMGAAR